MIPSLGREGIYPLVRYCPLCFQKELSDMTKMGQPPETAPWVGAGGFCGILFYHRNRIKIGAPLERVSTPKPSTLAARGGFEGRTSRCLQFPSLTNGPSCVLGAALASVRVGRSSGLPARAGVDVGVGFPLHGPRRATHPPPAPRLRPGPHSDLAKLPRTRDSQAHDCPPARSDEDHETGQLSLTPALAGADGAGVDRPPTSELDGVDGAGVDRATTDKRGKKTNSPGTHHCFSL